jgi:hypothetical protein
MGKREEKIRVRAYEIWEREGRTGDPQDHWHKAKAELKASETSVEAPQGRSEATVDEAPPVKAVEALEEATDSPAKRSRIKPSMAARAHRETVGASSMGREREEVADRVLVMLRALPQQECLSQMREIDHLLTEADVLLIQPVLSSPERFVDQAIRDNLDLDVALNHLPHPLEGVLEGAISPADLISRLLPNEGHHQE